jgi:hypothetical protein
MKEFSAIKGNRYVSLSMERMEKRVKEELER